MFILILMLVVNLMRSLKYVFFLFIGYGDEKFGYRFWDEQNRKIIRNRNVIFNEQVMYKDKSTVVPDVTEIDQKKSVFVNLDELTELPEGKKALHNKWVYRIKNKHDSSKRYKAKLVVKGF